MPAIGNRFELLIVDEVHHFGAGAHDMALEMCCATGRLGLTATLVLCPQAEQRVRELVGPTVFFLSSHELSGTRHLAPFELVVIAVDLEPDERRRYVRDRSLFRGFHQAFTRTSPGASFEQFVRDASGSDAGREVLAAWRRCRKLLAFPQAKARVLGDLLAQHRDARVLVFTADNETAYAIARAHLIMPITCDIPRREREGALAQFRAGGLRALVSARVLNEGLDVPDAEVAIIVGGTQGEREHVQRVGRLLRPAPGKCALVYELVVRHSSEVALSMRRSASLGPKTAAHLHRAR
jgi:superfamily II DNA or RNA helicase